MVDCVFKIWNVLFLFLFEPNSFFDLPDVYYYFMLICYTLTKFIDLSALSFLALNWRSTNHNHILCIRQIRFVDHNEKRIRKKLIFWSVRLYLGKISQQLFRTTKMAISQFFSILNFFNSFPILKERLECPRNNKTRCRFWLSVAPTREQEMASDLWGLSFLKLMFFVLSLQFRSFGLNTPFGQPCFRWSSRNQNRF